MGAFHKNTSLSKLTGTNTIKNNQKIFKPTKKKQPQVNVPHVTPIDHFAASKFSKQQYLQAPKPERDLYNFSPSHLP